MRNLIRDYLILLKFSRPYRGWIALAVAISAAVSALQAAVSVSVKFTLDDVLTGRNHVFFIAMSLCAFCLIIVRGALYSAYLYLMNASSHKIAGDIRTLLYKRLIRLPVRYFDNNAPGILVSNVLHDTNEVQLVVSQSARDLLIEGATAIALAAAAIWLRWDLALFFLVILPAAYYGLDRLGRNLKHISMDVQKKIASLTELLNERFSGIRLIRAFGMEDTESQRFDAVNRDFCAENMRCVKTSGWSAFFTEAVLGSAVLFGIGYGGWLVLGGKITVGDFMAVLTAVLLISTPVRRLVKVYNDVQKARSPLVRIQTLLSEPLQDEGTRQIRSFEKSIEFLDVTFSYGRGRKKALDCIRLTIRKGERLAIVGKSGSGKTTLVNLLPRFIDPVSGIILVDGVDIATATLESLRSLFAIVSQDVLLFNATVAENIRYGRPAASAEEVIQAARFADAHDFIMALPEGYDTPIGPRGLKLSGGQRQRISIARAVLRNPPVLIMDEATSSLDSATETTIQEALDHLMRDRTAIIIAHRLSTVQKADRIVVLDSGQIAATGTHESLMAVEGPYRRNHDLQFADRSGE